MKTAISLPDELFAAIDATARELGMSRSRLLAEAAAAYLDALERNDLTSRIDRALATVTDPDTDAAFQRRAAQGVLDHTDW